MKAIGELRRRLSGKEAAPYMGFARSLLGTMKQQMQYANLQQLSWQKTLANGVQIVVSSIFGQDEIHINVPTPTPILAQARTKKLLVKSKSSKLDIYYLTPYSKGLWQWVEDGSLKNVISDEVMKVLDLSSNANFATGLTADASPRVWTGGTSTYMPKDMPSPIDGIDYQGSLVISNDGSVIAGSSNESVFVWHADTGVQYLGLPAGSVVSDISADGKYITGNATGGISQAYRWSLKKGLELIGSMTAFSISSDGNTIVGYGSNNKSGVWTPQKGYRNFEIPNAYAHFALGVSANGKYVTGSVYRAPLQSGYAAYKWSEDEGVTVFDLIPLQPTYTPNSYGAAISNDGRTVAGFGSAKKDASNSFFALRWDGNELQMAEIIGATDIYNNAWIVEPITETEIEIEIPE